MPEEDDLNDLLIEIDDDWLEAYQQRRKQNRLKRENPWVFDLIRALAHFPNGSHKSWVVKKMEDRRKSLGLDSPKDFDANVRSCYNRFSVDNSAWIKAGRVEMEGIFYAPAGKGTGYWAMDRSKAQDFVKERLGMMQGGSQQ